MFQPRLSSLLTRRINEFSSSRWRYISRRVFADCCISRFDRYREWLRRIFNKLFDRYYSYNGFHRGSHFIDLDKIKRFDELRGYILRRVILWVVNAKFANESRSVVLLFDSKSIETVESMLLYFYFIKRAELTINQT